MLQQSPKLLAVGAFLIKDESVLLSLRQNCATDNGKYALIGGKVDQHEAIHQAIIREIFEEVGLIVKTENLQLMHVISFVADDSREIVSFDFMINVWEGIPFNKEPHI